MQVVFKKVFQWIFSFLVILALVFIYGQYNPNESALFPKCPFKVISGLDCPGCGSQRALHFLINFEILQAFKSNPLLVISIPYILLGFIFELIQEPTRQILKWRKTLFGTNAILIILIIVIGFWILRNLI